MSHDHWTDLRVWLRKEKARLATVVNTTDSTVDFRAASARYEALQDVGDQMTTIYGRRNPTRQGKA